MTQTGWLKSAFLTIWLAGLGLAGLHTGYLFYSQVWPWQHLPLLLGLMLPLLFFASLYWRRQARIGPYLTGWSALMAAGFIATSLQNLRPFNRLAMAYGLWAYLGWLAYQRWYSFLDRQPSASLKLGLPLPDFKLETPGGQQLSSLVFNQQAALWLFYRGAWSALCVNQIRELAALYRQINRQGVAIILVSGQSQRQTRRLAKRFDVPFTFLRDPDLKAARQLGLYHQHALPLGLQLLGHASDAYYPTAMISDAQGLIRYLDQSENDRDRPDPQLFLQTLQQMQQMQPGAAAQTSEV